MKMSTTTTIAKVGVEHLIAYTIPVFKTDIMKWISLNFDENNENAKTLFEFRAKNVSMYLFIHFEHCECVNIQIYI